VTSRTDDRVAPLFWVKVGPPSKTGPAQPSGGEQVDQSVRITSLKFEDDEAKPDKLTLVVDNYDLAALDSSLWRKGNIIEFQYGYPGRMSPQRTAVIQTVKGFLKLTVEAQSGDVIMNRKPDVSRVWKDVKRSDVVREIVKAYGYADDQLDIEDTVVVVPQVTQGPFTDYQIIQQLKWREGFEFWVDFAGVHFKKRVKDRPPIKVYTYFTEPGRGEMLGEPTIEDDISAGRKKVGAIVVRGTDPLTNERFEVRADNSTAQGRTALMPTQTVHELLDGSSGESTGEMKSIEGNGSEIVAPTTETTKAGAERQAKAHFEKVQMRAVKMGFSAIGDPGVQAKCVIRIEGIGKTYSGLWYARSVTHELSATNEAYKMSLKVSTDGVNGGTGGGAGPANPIGPPTAATQNPNTTGDAVPPDNLPLTEDSGEALQ
jgi:phage protein D